ncbi:protein of unknown function [Hyphomicrobium sp. MC1]|nr:protein of unknown function [Hyphomicrobium sp. MC1]
MAMWTMLNGEWSEFFTKSDFKDRNRSVDFIVWRRCGELSGVMGQQIIAKEKRDEILNSLLSVLDTLMKALDVSLEQHDSAGRDCLTDLISQTAKTIDAVSARRKSLAH